MNLMRGSKRRMISGLESVDPSLTTITSPMSGLARSASITPAMVLSSSNTGMMAETIGFWVGGVLLNMACVCFILPKDGLHEDTTFRPLQFQDLHRFGHGCDGPV